MSTLILFLPPGPPGPATEYGYTLSADGQTAIAQASAPAALLPEPARPGAEVVAVLPVRSLSWQRVQLPPGLPLRAGRQTPRLRLVLEGLLEERVLDEPARLHFALPPGAQAGQPLWVAVCERAWLREHMQALEAAGRRVTRVVPEFAPGPTASGGPQLCALGTPEQAFWVASGQGADQSLLLLPLGATAPGLAHPAAAQDQELAVQAEPAVAALAERALGRRVALCSASQRALDAARSDWDLAQFDLASSGRSRALRRAGGALSAWLYAPRWRAARCGAGLLVLAQLLGLNAWAWQEREALAAKDNAVRAALTQTFAQVRVVVDAPLQMERQLALLRQAAGSVSARDFEPLLAAAGAALPAGRLPTAIDYRPGELRLRGLALALEEATALLAELQAATAYRASLDDGGLLLRAADEAAGDAVGEARKSP